MATQRLSLDPKLWARTRRMAFDLGLTASRVTEIALESYLDNAAAKTNLRASPASSQVPPPAVAAPWDGSRTENTVPTEVGVPSVVGNDSPFVKGRDQGPGSITVVPPETVSPKITTAAILVNSPEEAARKAAEILAYRHQIVTPIPKPVSKKRAPRTRP
jgi:hypothetical protein